MILGRRVTAQDVAWLKREVFRRPRSHAANRLMNCSPSCALRWIMRLSGKSFFVDMITEHVVRQGDKPGVVSDEEGRSGLWPASMNARRSKPWPRLVNVCAEAPSRAPTGFVGRGQGASCGAAAPQPPSARRLDSPLIVEPPCGLPMAARYRRRAAERPF